MQWKVADSHDVPQLHQSNDPEEEKGKEVAAAAYAVEVAACGMD
jgi:hypothetical protein